RASDDQRSHRPGAGDRGRPLGVAGGLAGGRLVLGAAMNSHDVTIVGYLAVLGLGVMLQLLATRTRLQIPPLGDVFSRAMHSRTGRIGILVAWAWIGLHFFAR